MSVELASFSFFSSSSVVSATLLPDNEAARLASLYSYDILHTPQEGVFDQLVALSARLFGMSVSFVLLLDAEQGHYKAIHGLAHLPPQPRQDLLCAQVIQHERVVVYHDLAATPQALSDAQAITHSLAQHMRFYAGAPLRMPDQFTIGTLCLVDQRPRSFNSHEQTVLEELAGVVSLAVATRYQCQRTLALGEVHWQAVCAETRDEVHQLATLVRYLLTRYPHQTVPVPDEVLHLVSRRLQDLRELLTECL